MLNAWLGDGTIDEATFRALMEMPGVGPLDAAAQRRCTGLPAVREMGGDCSREGHPRLARFKHDDPHMQAASDALLRMLQPNVERETRVQCSMCGRWNGVDGLAAISAGTALCKPCAGEKTLRTATGNPLDAFVQDIRGAAAQLLLAQAARIDELETAWAELEASALEHGLVLGSDGRLRKQRDEVPSASAQFSDARVQGDDGDG